MSIRNQLIIVVLLSMFVVMPFMAIVFGLGGMTANLVITISLIMKYWKDI